MTKHYPCDTGRHSTDHTAGKSDHYWYKRPKTRDSEKERKKERIGIQYNNNGISLEAKQELMSLQIFRTKQQLVLFVCETAMLAQQLNGDEAG